MRTTAGWRADGPAQKLHQISLQRSDLRADDIAVRIDYCGVCHTDLHSVHHAQGPVVPGHEFTGTVTEIGPEVTGFAVGDRVAVGNIVDSCGECAMCRKGQENFCHRFPLMTYGGVDADGSITLGGYSREYVVREGFAYPLPDGLDPAAAAPLLCAGITVWEPLRALGVGAGTRAAVAGLGGLGHLAVKFAVALGAEATVISRTPGKADDARGLGAQGFLVSTDEEAMAAARDTFDVIIDTISVAHDLGPHLRLVAMDGTLSMVGHIGPIAELNSMDLLVGRKKLSSAGSGGRPATREMLDFAAAHGITADVETLPSAQVNEAFDRVERNDVRYRLVLDMSDLD